MMAHLLWLIYPFFPNQLKKVKKKLDTPEKAFWIRACSETPYDVFDVSLGGGGGGKSDKRLKAKWSSTLLPASASVIFRREGYVGLVEKTCLSGCATR